jgi:hypothetical protein
VIVKLVIVGGNIMSASGTVWTAAGIVAQMFATTTRHHTELHTRIGNP